MAKHVAHKRKGKQAEKRQPDFLKGWQQIATFLAQPTVVAQRWAREGMPISRQGRFVVAKPEDLAKWLGRVSGEPIHVVTDQAELASELKRSLTEARKPKTKPA